MKKIFTLFTAVALGSYVYGQRAVDLSIQTIVEPTEIQSVGQTTPIPINVAVYNDGPDDLAMGDSIYFLMQLVAGSDVVTQTSNANQGVVVYGAVLHRNVTSGDTFHFVTELTAPIYAFFTFEVDFIIAVVVVNRPGLPFEDQGTITNNLSRKDDILFYNEYRYPLNTNVAPVNGLAVYPNPAASEVRIAVAAGKANETSTLSIYDIQGKLVHSESSAAGSLESYSVNTSAYKDGVYVIKITNGDLVQTGKLVVKH